MAVIVRPAFRFLLVSVLVLSACAQAEVGQPPQPTRPPLLTGDLSVEIGKLQVALESGEASTFAGLWIEHEPRFRVVARFTRDGAKTLSRYVAGTPLQGIVEAAPARYSLAQLRADIEAIATHLSGGPFAGGINVRENRIDLDVESREEIEAFARASGFALPPTVHLVIRGPSGPLECGDNPGAPLGVFFPRHCTRPWQPVPAGAIEGQLVLKDGCLWIVPPHGKETYLALWPPGWLPLRVGEALEIHDRAGVRRGVVGEKIGVGGGERPWDPQDIAQLIRREPPPECRGHRAWFVSGPLRP